MKGMIESPNRDIELNYPIEIMRFMLTYEGLLPPSAHDARVIEKHDIRKVFHPQLWEMWHSNVAVEGWIEQWRQADAERDLPDDKKKAIVDVFAVKDFRFVPVITRRLFLTCELHITVLRYQPPGRNMDLDNRLLTLFDALRKPHKDEDLPPTAIPDSNEIPFCCLLEDDSLITDYSVHTDRLLKPQKQTRSPEYVMLNLEVIVKTSKLLHATIQLLGG